jgi:hypothetical protein
MSRDSRRSRPLAAGASTASVAPGLGAGLWIEDTMQFSEGNLAVTEPESKPPNVHVR